MTNNATHFVAVTTDHHGEIHHTAHFVPKAPKAIIMADYVGQRMSTYNTGMYGVHVYLPEMNWAKRLVQNALKND